DAQDGGVTLSLVERSGEDDLAALDHVETLRPGGDVVDVRLGDQYAAALTRDGRDRVADGRDDGRRQALERFIEQQQDGVQRERAGDRQHLALAAGDGGAAAIGVPAQPR